MLPAVSTRPTTPHETVDAFNSIHLPLNKQLQSMLNEDLEHQRPRRGCGFTQASRFLADIVNQPRGLSPDRDLRLFSETGQKQLLKMIGASQAVMGKTPTGITELRISLESSRNITPYISEYISQLNALEAVTEKLEFEESRLISELILSILGKTDSSTELTVLPLYDHKLAIGTCPEAERYFLEFSGGYTRRQGIINILTDDEQPVLVEKMNIGDSHSCITIRDTLLNGVLLPAGSLLGTTYCSLPITTPRCGDVNGAWMPVSVCDGFRFLRLTTLAVSPENRMRAYKNHIRRQLEGCPFFDPLNTTLSDLAQNAAKQNPLLQQY